MNKLTIVFSGKKSSGKTSIGKYALAYLLNNKIGQKRFIVEKSGKETLLIDSFNNNHVVDIDRPSEDSDAIASTYSVKMYSFADPLKSFCIKTYGFDIQQCYGTDDDKNSVTHVSWDSFPMNIRIKYSKPRRGGGGIKPASGLMTAREVMQVFGTDVCRRIDTNCWARGLYSTIENDGYDLAIVTDARFPNEITMGTERGAKVCRLTRHPFRDEHESELALDTFPLGEYTMVMDNTEMSMTETHDLFTNNLKQWYTRHGLI